MNRSRAVLLALGATVVLGACGGPSLPVQIAGKSVPIDVAFGDRKDEPKTTEVPRPVEATAPVQVVPSGDGFVVIPREVPPTPLQPFPVPPKPMLSAPCPDASPFAFPAREATSTIDTKAPAGKYRFRTEGTFDLTTLTGRYPAAEERQVGNVTETAAFKAFDVTEVRPDVAQITTYRASAEELGLTQVTSVVRRTVTSPPETVRFTPLTPVRILPLPPRQTNPAGQSLTTWTSVGVDPTSGTTMTVDGNLLGKERVNACGQVIDAWLAELSVRYVGPNESYTGLWRVHVATGHGGLIVADAVNVQGTRFGLPYRSERRSTINEVPA